MMKKVPKKPTSEFGYYLFPVLGETIKVSSKLSVVKDQQELDAISVFANQYNMFQPLPHLTDLVQLPENDHDFSAMLGEARILIQLTELTDRTYTHNSPDTVPSSNSQGLASFRVGRQSAAYIDLNARNQALKRVIQKKVEKYYVKPSEQLWLVVFTTDSSFTTEYSEDGIRKQSDALINARKYVNSVDCVFDKIWFTKLFGRPVLI
ncbi:hypothetical protein M1B72_00740 [Geomonas paludis]|uniref:Uncharacterized protein n=1 Tax=Geomonas paludis TaxID=2740185 RepID=A0ABY4LE39_9BACT|nr:hypothetical protein [Geomonas paludis]UPU36260.1 hypothetical protein M1B72_00740 [Geomonas paludis]